MLAKLKNGQLILLPKTYEHDGISYSNYDALQNDGEGLAVLASHGWKPLIETPMPEPQEGVGYNPVYEDTGDSIVMSWEAYEIEEPEAQPDYMAFIAGLMEGYGDE